MIGKKPFLLKYFLLHVSAVQRLKRGICYVVLRNNISDTEMVKINKKSRPSCCWSTFLACASNLKSALFSFLWNRKHYPTEAFLLRIL